jgi:hemoglobin
VEEQPMMTLYEWAGGEEAIRRLIDAFYDRVEGDELLSPFFAGGVSEDHRAHVTVWWREVFGGPGRYTEELGGYETCSRTTVGLGSPQSSGFASPPLLSLAADDAAFPDDPEFRSALVAYVEWGTRLALHNSQPDVEVFEHAPVPRWGWGEAPPFRG